VAGDWGDTRLPLPRGSWKNQFTGAVSQGAVSPGELFDQFPVALLIRSENSSGWET